MSQRLARSLIFSTVSEDFKLSTQARTRLAYERAKAIAALYVPTPEDVVSLSPKFWAMFKDPLCAMDAAAFTHLTLQHSLCSGIIAAQAGKGPDVQAILKQIFDFEVVVQFCLTEVDHGLDAAHLETTATALADNTFLLNTPHEGAAKFMPPTTPTGIPCIAIVFARTIVHGQDYGVKPFLVHIHDGKSMARGIVSKLLPCRGGSNPVKHALTLFNNVHLPRSALIGTLEKPADFHAAYLASISRLAVGMVALTSLAISQLAISCHISARYSQRRMVHDSSRNLRPILSFQTQRIPVLAALAQVFVLRAMRDTTMAEFSLPNLDPRMRHAIVTIFKVASVVHVRDSTLELGERCGAQGAFPMNQISVYQSDLRSIAIAEGDILVVSIRLASELLLGRYALPSSMNPDSLLARHEAGIYSQLRTQLAGLGNHRSAEYNAVLLPEALPFVRAIGQRAAYDAARTAGVDACLLDMYVANCARQDESWYVESLGMTRRELRAMEARAVEALFLRLDEFLALMDVEAYVTAPIISADRWSAFVGRLPTYGDGKQGSDLHAGAPGHSQHGQKTALPPSTHRVALPKL
ncbi:acyl-CoA dehydrogenase NM domain-like protein [Gloeopeniophorella convolvens]|nr:acyl-CoA dehydrogenase NM domain-like protein [Gloeopeniophorella convolvens]